MNNYPDDPYECERCRWVAPPPGRAGGELRVCSYHRGRQPVRELVFQCLPADDYIPREQPKTLTRAEPVNDHDHTNRIPPPAARGFVPRMITPAGE